MIVRELKASDFEKYKGLFLTLENLRPVGVMSVFQAKCVLEKINRQDGHILVAIDNDEIVGAATILIEHKFIRQGASAGHIEDVATRKGCEGRGIGKAVVGATVEYAKKRGCYKVILDCGDELVPFYEKMGFQKTENQMRLDL